MILGEYYILGNQLKGKRVVRNRIVVHKNNRVIISGKVTDKMGEPIKDAIIKIETINYCYKPYEETVVGYSVTDYDGSYYILINRDENVEIRLTIYKQVIECSS